MHSRVKRWKHNLSAQMKTADPNLSICDINEYLKKYNLNQGWLWKIVAVGSLREKKPFDIFN
jgi:hypothetical protein